CRCLRVPRLCRAGTEDSRLKGRGKQAPTAQGAAGRRLPRILFAGSFVLRKAGGPHRAAASAGTAMPHLIRYKLKPDRVAENERLVAAVFDALEAARPPGLRYA